MHNDDQIDAFVVVLTGGIASGKTAISALFAEKGIQVVDTDVIARALVEPGEPALTEIVSEFGAEVLKPDGSLDRKHMRQLIFSDPLNKQKLEAILHPAIRESSRHQLILASSEYCILVVPLLAESGGKYLGDRVLVVDVEDETQLLRVMNRDGITREQAESILAAQADRGERLAFADDVVVNDADLANLARKVNVLHASYLQLARKKQTAS